MDINEIIEKALPTSIGVIIGSTVTILLFFIGKYFDNRKDKKDRKLKIYAKLNALTYTLVNEIGGKDYHKVYNNYFTATENIVILPEQKEKARLESEKSFDKYLEKRESTLQLLTQIYEYVYEYNYITKRKDIIDSLNKLLETKLDSDYDYQFIGITNIGDANRKRDEMLFNITVNLNVNITPKIRELLLLLEK